MSEQGEKILRSFLGRHQGELLEIISAQPLRLKKWRNIVRIASPYFIKTQFRKEFKSRKSVFEMRFQISFDGTDVVKVILRVLGFDKYGQNDYS